MRTNATEVMILPRTAREKSRSGIYHVMLRGINKQNIFEEVEDYEKMMDLLRQRKEADGITLYGYCFMSNHIHLPLEREHFDASHLFSLLFRNSLKQMSQNLKKSILIRETK